MDVSERMKGLHVEILLQEILNRMTVKLEIRGNFNLSLFIQVCRTDPHLLRNPAGAYFLSFFFVRSYNLSNLGLCTVLITGQGRPNFVMVSVCEL